jgi:hypothetical protein
MAKKPAQTSPRPIDDDALRQLADDHLRYELQQMALGTFRSPPTEQYLANVIQEAFLVHVRVLDDFLGKVKPAVCTSFATGSARSSATSRNRCNYWRRRRESNPCPGFCRPLPEPLGYAAGAVV